MKEFTTSSIQQSNANTDKNGTLTKTEARNWLREIGLSDVKIGGGFGSVVDYAFSSTDPVSSISDMTGASGVEEISINDFVIAMEVMAIQNSGIDLDSQVSSLSNAEVNFLKNADGQGLSATELNLVFGSNLTQTTASAPATTTSPATTTTTASATTSPATTTSPDTTNNNQNIFGNSDQLATALLMMFMLLILQQQQDTPWQGSS